MILNRVLIPSLKVMIICGMLLSSLAFGRGFADDVWSRVNEGWGGPYTQLENWLHPDGNYIVWSIIAPKDPLDLRKPDFFRRIVSANAKENMSISHNLVAWRCTLPNGEFYMGATGDSGERSHQSSEMVKAGWGLTTFLAVFTDGWLSSGFQTGDIFVKRSKKEEIYSVAVQVSGQDCARMLGFLKKFIYHPNQPVKKFGLTVEPEKFEGAGCVSFAAALLKKAGILTDLFKASKRSLWASTYRFGGNDLPLPIFTEVPVISWRREKTKKVSVLEFLNANWNAGLRGVNLKLIDPELLVWGIKSLSPQMAQHPRWIWFDRDGRYQDRGQISRIQVRIDDDYDSQAKAASTKARAWKRKMLNKGYQMSELKLIGEHFLIFQR